ncbi:MAG: Propanediol utilization protein [Firmicutes bacterium]|nr:Propanediol utilization protein [Bacillota bacterium]
MDPKLIETVVACVVKGLGYKLPVAERNGIPVGISNRHIHLSLKDAAVLFGDGYNLTKVRDLSQIGEYAAAEMVTLVGPKGVIPGVRILGPFRNHSQVEISRTDGFMLGIRPPIRDSGKITGSAGLTLVGPVGALTLKEGVITAARHIHMSDIEASVFNLKDGDFLTVETAGLRASCLKNVLVRVGPNFRLELHIDTDEANATGLNNGDLVSVVPG